MNDFVHIIAECPKCGHRNEITADPSADEILMLCRDCHASLGYISDWIELKPAHNSLSPPHVPDQAI